MDYTLHKPAGCAACTLYTEPGPCWGSGDPLHAKLIYIGQNPGAEEVAATPMQPFVGAAGRIFNRQLFEANVRRSAMFITNVVKCKTPDNRTPTQHEVECCRPLLEKELSLVSADTVLLAGDIAHKTLIGTYSSIHPSYRPVGGVFQRMGCVERKDNRKWITTIHPAAFFRDLPPEMREAPVLHLRKALAISGQPLKEITINEHPTDAELLSLVDFIKLSSHEYADDVETMGNDETEEDDYVGSDHIVTMCGIGGRPYEALIATPAQMPLLTPLFTDASLTRYEHNGAYDDYHIQAACSRLDYLDWLEVSRAYRWDTMLGTHYLRSNQPKKLKPYCLSTYTCLPYYQGAGSKKDNLALACGTKLYNGMDVITTYLVGKEIRRQLRAEGLEDLINTLGFPILPIFEEWRRIGCRVDLRAAYTTKLILNENISHIEKLLADFCGPDFTWTNHFHIKDILYNKFSLPKQYVKMKRRSAGFVEKERLTSNDQARENLIRWITQTKKRQSEHEDALRFILAIGAISEEKKKLEYIDRISPDLRIHPYFKAHGTEIFRPSATPNILNFPKDMRHIIIPDDDQGWLLSCDYNQMQIWIYMEIANVQWLREVYASGDYIYGYVYEQLFKPDKFFDETGKRTKRNMLPSVTEGKLRAAKTVPLGYLFGRSASAVARSFGSLKEAEKLREWWFSNCPELTASYAKTKYEMVQKGRIRHAFGQITHTPGQKLTEAINSKAISNEAFIMYGSLIAIHNELKRRGLRQKGHRLMLSVYDSLTINISGKHLEDTVEIYEDIVKPILERPIPQLNNLCLRHEATMARAWDHKAIDYWDWKEKYAGETKGSPTGVGMERSSSANNASSQGPPVEPRLALIQHVSGLDQDSNP